MRRTLILLAAFLMLAAKKECQTFVLTFDGVTMANGIADVDIHSLVKHYGQRFAYFARDGRRYVIRDGVTLDRLQALYAPQVQLGQKQAELGQQQAALGRQQAELGREQAALGREQARFADSSSPRYQKLVDQQNELARRQNVLADEQNRLGGQQNVMGQKQEDLQREAERLAAPILDQAISAGLAVDVNRK